MNKEQAVKYLSFSGFSDEQIKAIEGAFSCEDAISRTELLKAIDTWDKFGYTETGCFVREPKNDCVKYIHYDDVIECIKGMPPVNQFKPINCPSMGIDCEDCPAYEDTISRRAVIDTLERMDKALDEDRTVESYKELLRECYKVLPKKSEWEHDHEILKAYSDGASAVLDKVRAEIDGLLNDEDNSMYAHGVMDCLEIIDKFMAEGSDKE